MESHSERTHILQCPICRVDTPHRVFGQRRGMGAVLCTRCQSGALVPAASLRLSDPAWESELCELLEGILDTPPDGADR
ncbi:MAG TPA: hypothetical protein VF234_05315 [Limnochordia bacterium]